MSKPLHKLVTQWKRDAREARVRGPLGRHWANGVDHCIETLVSHEEYQNENIVYSERPRDQRLDEILNKHLRDGILVNSFNELKEDLLRIV